jgi:glycosyltransferase involved in cell wall biosynthesis
MTTLAELKESNPVLNKLVHDNAAYQNVSKKEMPPKTIYIASRLSVGGAEKFMISLSNALSVYNHQQVIVSLAATNPLEDEINDKISFIRFPRKSKFDFGPVLKLRKLIKEENANTIFCLNFFSYFIVRLAMTGLKTKSKRIISYHSTIHSFRKDHLLHKLYTFIFSKKDLIVTVSKNQAAYTAQYYKIPSRHFQTIHNGIDTNFWTLPPPNWNSTETRKKFGIPENAKVIIKAAAFRPEKNHLGALKALHILHTKYNIKAYLLLAGDGVMREKIEKAIAEYNMQEYVKLAGNQKDLRPLYWSSNLFSLCSTSVETFSIAALEGLACGLPAVLTNIGGANEMIVEEMNGLLCAPNEDSIAEAWSKVLSKEFSAKEINQFISNHFSLDQMVEKYKKILL